MTRAPRISQIFSRMTSVSIRLFRFGFDRLCSLFGGSESIRDYIAFPKNNAGRDVMLDAPSAIDPAQLDELYLALKAPEAK